MLPLLQLWSRTSWWLCLQADYEDNAMRKPGAMSGAIVKVVWLRGYHASWAIEYVCQGTALSVPSQEDQAGHSDHPYTPLLSGTLSRPWSGHRGSSYPWPTVVSIMSSYSKICLCSPDQKATRLAHLLIKEIVPVFGTPDILLPDCGTHRLSHTMKDVCQLLGTNKLNITWYHSLWTEWSRGWTLPWKQCCIAYSKVRQTVGPGSSQVLIFGCTRTLPTTQF